MRDGSKDPAQRWFGSLQVPSSRYMALADPSEEERVAWKVLNDMLAWTGLSGDPKDENTEAGSLLRLLGATEETPIRILGSISEPDYMEVIKSWNPQGAPPTPTSRSKAAILGRGCRIASGQQLPFEEEQKQLALKLEREHEIALASIQSQNSQLPNPNPALLALSDANSGSVQQSTLPVTLQKKVKMNMVVDQVYDQEIDCLKEEDVIVYYKNYTDVFGDMPPAEEEITIEQLTALWALVKSGAPPYVDFSVWGPHGYRLMRKLRLTGLQLTPGGDLRQVELSGPPTFGMWERCYKCLKTGLIMLKCVGIAKILKYHEVQKAYHERYGPACWHLQYQSEVRMRQERMIFWKRQGQDEHRRAIAANGVSEYNPDSPWEYVWGKAADDFHYWRKELEDPCLLILTRTRSLGALVDGDVSIADEPAAKRARLAPASTVQKSNWETGLGSSELPTKKGKSERLHNTNNGCFTTNRRGVPVCDGFNAGTCTQTTGQNRCAADPTKIHQCSKCLSVDHPASACTKTPGPPPQQPAWLSSKGGKSGGGKGGEKSKGKSKKGSRWYYG